LSLFFKIFFMNYLIDFIFFIKEMFAQVLESSHNNLNIYIICLILFHNLTYKKMNDQDFLLIIPNLMHHN